MEAGKPLVMYILDLVNVDHRNPFINGWNWELAAMNKMSCLYEVTGNELRRNISPHLPEGKKVRKIIGALTNPQPTEGSAPSDVTRLQFNED